MSNVPDRTTFADALAVLAKYRIEPPAAVRAHLEKGAAGEIEETLAIGSLLRARAPAFILFSMLTLAPIVTATIITP